MNWFKNQKIKTKLLLSFLLMALISGVIGYEGVTGLQKADESDTYLYEKNAIPVAIGGQLSTKFQEQMNTILQIVIFAQDKAMSAELTKETLDRSTVTDQLISQFEKTLVDETDKKLFDEFMTERKSFKTSREKILSLINQGSSEEALQYFKSEMAKVNKNVTASLNKMVEDRIQNAKERSDLNTIEANSAIRSMIIYIIIGILLALLIGLWLSKIISTPLSQAVTMIEDLKLGHLDKRMNLNTSDEIGIMARAMDQFADELKTDVVGTLIKISEGDTSVAVKPKDDKDEISPALNRLTATVNDLIFESAVLSKAAIDGKLDTRGNADKFMGGYKEIVMGVNATLDAVIKPVKEGSAVLEIMATGDLTPRVTGDYKGDHRIIADSINTLGDSISNMLRSVTESVQATASASSQISSSTEEMAAGSQEQSAQAGEVATAVQEMTATILEATQNASRAANFANKAGSVAKVGSDAVHETIIGMNRISEVVQNAASTVQALGKSSEQIGEIVQVIDDIADQTNLLALNAAIEAARAGEQGRGFAVVADEVRKLAERTTKATKEIGQMIRSIQTDTNGAVTSMNLGTEEVKKGAGLANKAGESLEDILQGISNVISEINQVAASSEEQSSAAEQISKNIESISAVTHESASGTQQIARAAEDLNRLTDNLQNMISQFKVDNHSGYGHRQNSLASASNNRMLKR